MTSIALYFPSVKTISESVDEGLYRLDEAAMIASYRLGKMIDEKQIGKIAAVAIPVMCVLTEMTRMISDMKSVLDVAVRSVVKLQFESGNARSFILKVSEHGRNIVGIATGLFLGLYDIKRAREAFLTVPARDLKPEMDDLDAARLYATAYALHSFFGRHHIDYRLCAGSVLGLERHEGVIPWDDDIDIMVHPDSVERLEILFKEGEFTRETGILVKEQSFTGGWECFHPNCKTGVGLMEGIGSPFVDVFRTKFDGDLIVYESYNMRQSATDDYISKQSWEDSWPFRFGPTHLVSVKSAKEYISRCYGRDALNFGYQMIPHDQLAIMWQNLLDINGHIAKLQKYGFPRRAYIEDRSSLPYNEEVYDGYEESIEFRSCDSSRD